MIKKKLVYIVSDIDKSLHFEWIAPYLSENFHLSFILVGKRDSSLEQFLRARRIPVVPLSYKRKLDLVLVWFRVLRIIFEQRPDIIHTHLWIANLIGLTTGWLNGVRKRIYTRHHASIHYKQYPTGLKWDKLNNRLATCIIAISKNIQDILINQDKAHPEKVRLIYHGFLFPYFEEVDPARIQTVFKKYNITTADRPVIGVISRFIEWKGVQFAIQAFKQFLTPYPHAHLILANANGDYQAELNKLLSDLPSSSFTVINFEQDLAALYRVFNIFLHVPVDPQAEAFGQTYVEPLIVGIPCIFTLSGIAREIIKHRENALVVDFQNIAQIYAGMVELMNDSSLRNSLISNGKSSVASFTMETYLQSLKNLYLE